MREMTRCYEQLTANDLRALARLALEKLEDVFARAPVAGLYRDRLILLALCQGAAQHYIDESNGVKDLDVWAFFRAGASKPFPWRPVWNADFGCSRLGRSPVDKGYLGRRIDIMGRSIEIAENQTAQDAVLAWLRGGGKSAICLRTRPAIALSPERLFGNVLWLPRQPAAT